MKKTVTYILLAAGLLAVTASCRREKAPEEQTGDSIRVSVVGAEMASKGFLGANDIRFNGTTVRVYDYLTGFSGEYDHYNYNGGELMYIPGTPLQYLSSSSDWDFTAGKLWQWTRTGTHNFFGWLTEDCSVNPSLKSADLWDNSSDDISFDEAHRLFTVPTISFSRSTKQFDLCYSNWVPVESATRTGDQVVLPLRHAFMALAVNISNSSEDRINLKSVQFSGFKNVKSAQYAYGGSDLTYANQGETNFLATWTGTKDLSKGKKYNLFTGAEMTSSTEPDYILMWPQTVTEVDNTVIIVKYTIEGVYDPDNTSQLQEFTKELPLRNSGLTDSADNTLPMNAGTKYNLGIQFKGKTVDLTLSVKDWVMDYSSIDYSTDAILANSQKANEGVLWLYNKVWDAQNSVWKWEAGPRSREITFINGEVEGYFYILAPTSGQWRVTTYPAEAAQYFRLEPSTGSIDDLYDNNGDFIGEVVFKIYANGNPPTTQVLHFNVDILMNGSWRNANTEFNRKDWRLTREP